MPECEKVGLWKRAMKAAPANKEAVDRLVNAHRLFWINAVALARRIQADVPNLTLHDESHFIALWQRADQIAGPEFRLSPLEAFIFGGAILLHDAANSVAAFPGGLADIRTTPDWLDAAAAWLEDHGRDDADLPAEAEKAVLFDTLRSLHAERAETLAGMTVSKSGDTVHLLPDDGLRSHLGRLIGKIAASHHWNVADLEKGLPPTHGSLAGMPADWTVRPVLLACLLRCADATQLDQSRAPDFLFGLLKLHGVSLDHWKAQNRLTNPHPDRDDPRALVFTSSAFPEEDADAWWVARDALVVADRELRACDALLRDLRLPTFAIDRIRDAASTERLADHVRVEGWRPVEAEVKISRVDRVVDMFGGEQLYGDDPTVPLRELIQNAVDAISQRRALEPDFEGHVTIRLEAAADRPGFHHLSVEDDGIGMSEAVLTGPLIDFGAGYMTSRLVREERPGLRGKRRKRVGRYGIGFFSCFMLAEDVAVTSRPYDEALAATRTLKFRKGIATRPLLTTGRPEDFRATASTRVTLLIDEWAKAKLLTIGQSPEEVPVALSLRRLVGALCPMVDADIDVIEAGTSTRVHTRRGWEGDRRAWLERILLVAENPAFYRGPGDIEANLTRAASLLDFVDDEDRSAGLACISGAYYLGIATIGGLRGTLAFGSDTSTWVGCIDHEPSGPRRQAGSPRAPAKMARWATRQSERLASHSTSLQNKIDAAAAIASFGGDATAVAVAQLDGVWKPAKEIYREILSEIEFHIPAHQLPGGHFHLGEVSFEKYNLARKTIIEKIYIKYLLRTIEVRGGSFDGEADVYNTYEPRNEGVDILSIAIHNLRSQGYTLDIAPMENIIFGRYIGPPNVRDGLVRGTLLSGPGLKLRARKIGA